MHTGLCLLWHLCSWAVQGQLLLLLPLCRLRAGAWLVCCQKRSAPFQFMRMGYEHMTLMPCRWHARRR